MENEPKCYTVPSVYQAFACKCGKCRSVCCHGWNVSLPMSEYFRLLGLDCAPDLRRRLDVALRVVENPTPDRYAQFVHGEDGGCPIHGEDGLCMLQKSLGESAIPPICRRYPRRRNSRLGLTAAVSLGCEETAELLMDTTLPLTFHELMLPDENDPPVPYAGKDAAEAAAMRDDCIALLLESGKAPAEKMKAVCARLSGRQTEETAADDLRPLTAALLMVSFFNRSSLNLQKYSGRIYAGLGLAGEDEEETAATLGRFRERAAALKARFPLLDEWSSRFFAHHVFYTEFPADFGPRPDLAPLALTAAWALWRLSVVTVLDADSTEADFADVSAAIFRLIESSDFHRRAVALLYREGVAEADLPAALAAL